MCADEKDTIELPKFYFGEGSYAQQEDGNYFLAYEFALASCDDMLILAGPAAKDGSSDTFVLKAGEKSFSPYNRRISDAEVMMPCAAALDGRLYVIGASAFEPGKRVFRSTLMRDTEKYAITYDLNGGSFDGSTENIIEEYDKGTFISIHEAPERDGYTFTYWKGSEYLPGDRYTVTENHTFTAQWVKNEESDDSSVDESDGKKGDDSDGKKDNEGNKDDGGHKGDGGNKGNGNGGSKGNSGSSSNGGSSNSNSGSKSNGGNSGSGGSKSNGTDNSSNVNVSGVRTGDDSHTGLWAALALLAAMTLRVITVRIRSDN